MRNETTEDVPAECMENHKTIAEHETIKFVSIAFTIVAKRNEFKSTVGAIYAMFITRTLFGTVLAVCRLFGKR